MQLAVGCEVNFEKNLAFEPQVARFLGINRLGLVQNFNRRGSGAIALERAFPRSGGDLLGSEASGRDLTRIMRIPMSGTGDAVAETRTGHRAFDALGASGAVADSCTFRQ